MLPVRACTHLRTPPPTPSTPPDDDDDDHHHHHRPYSTLHHPQVPEVISVTVPASAIVSQQPMPAGSFNILADAGQAFVTGTLLAAPSELTLTSLTSELVVTLLNDTWDASLATNDLLAQELAQGITGLGGGTSLGWDGAIQATLSLSNLQVVTESQVVITISPTTAYQASAQLATYN